MILVGVDPCFSCNDRTVVVRDTSGAAWTWERLRRRGIEARR
jgi:NADH-quinone oxidoreductase subunit D